MNISAQIDRSIRDLRDLFVDAKIGDAPARDPHLMAETLAPYVLAMGTRIQIREFEDLSKRAENLAER